MAGRRGAVVAVACAAIVAFLLGYWPLRLIGEGWLADIADDAFYYFIVARNLAESGRSSFDGQVLTNGYHPLWQFWLAVQYWLVGSSIPVTLAVQVALVTLAAFFVLRAAGDWLWFPLMAAAIWGTTYRMVLLGMETALLLLFFSLFLLALRRLTWIWVGVTATLAIASRLDSALFILPALVLVPMPFDRRFKALAFVGTCGALYAAFNQAVFGVWMPISGSIKSLSGGGLNQLFVEQITNHWDAWRPTVFAILKFAGTPEGQCASTALAGVVLLILAVDRRRTFAWTLLLAMIVGFALFVAKILFFSSWMLWPWYYFPASFLLIADFLVIAEIFSDRESGSARKIAAAIVASLVIAACVTPMLASAMLIWMFACAFEAAGGRSERGVAVREAATFLVGVCILVGAAADLLKSRPASDLYQSAAQAVATKVRAEIGDVHVAMGDRGGAFAYFYGNPVTQLEGLVNDSEYFRTMMQRRPIRGLLCRRGVRYIVGFESDLGDYAVHALDLFNSETMTFAGPTIDVAKADEIVRIADPIMLKIFPRSGYVYVWRLSGC